MYFDDDFFGRFRRLPADPGEPPFGIPRFPITPPGQIGPGFIPGAPGTDGPPGPPPSFIPNQEPLFSPRAVDPGAIRGCLFRFTFIWLNNGQRFWSWLVFVGPRSAAGWRWTGRRWVYFGIDLRHIASFTCY